MSYNNITCFVTCFSPDLILQTFTYRELAALHEEEAEVLEEEEETNYSVPAEEEEDKDDED